MKLQFGTLVTAMSGKLGGCVASHNRYGYYLRNLVKPTKPLTDLQSTARDIFSNASAVWPTTTPSQRSSWENYAASVPVQAKKGLGFDYIAGNAMCTRINAARITAGLGSVSDPPAVLTNPVTDNTIVSTCTASTHTLTVAFNNALPWAQLATSRLAVYMAAPRAPGRKFNSSSFRLVGTIAGNTTPPTTPHSFTSLPFTVVAGQVIRVKYRIITLLNGVSEYFGSNDAVIA